MQSKRPMATNLTVDQAALYVGRGGAQCPFCGSFSIEGAVGVQCLENKAHMGVTCLACDQSWIDEFVLCAVLNADGSAPE